MKKLAISIPNYNRLDKLNELLSRLTELITLNEMYDKVQVCICDDCSPEDPTLLVKRYVDQNPQIDICYQRNETNLGMSRNFLKTVLMADAEYCWIIGNDDLPENEGVTALLDYLDQNVNVDFVVTPFDVYSEGEFHGTIHPLSEPAERIYDTGIEAERIAALRNMQHNSAIFGFLSNVVFRREIWENRKTRFADKLDTLFIQMYINIDALLLGARYGYLDSKIIRNNLDNETNNSLKRISGVLFGLDDIVEYFFAGEEKKWFKKILTDPFINGVLWDSDKQSEYYTGIKRIKSEKNRIYEKYFIRTENRKEYFSGKPVMIYGAGDYGERAIKELQRLAIQVIGVADSSKEKQGQNFEDLTICSVEALVKKCYENQSVVVVANHHHLTEMVETVERLGIDKIAVIT